MIQVPEGVDRGHYLYSKYAGAITRMVLTRKEQWFSSREYKGLQNRVRAMDKYIDNQSPTVGTFLSDITPPTIRRNYYDFVALFNKFLETDPLFTAKRNNKSNPDTVKKLQTLLTDSLDKTYFRERCLQWNIDQIVRYGTSVTYTFATNDYNANSLMTVKDEQGYGDYKQVYGMGENVVMSTPVHPLNAIVDSRSNFQVSPDFIGFIGDICLSNIKALMDNPVYFRSEMKEVWDNCKKGLPDEHWFDGGDSSGLRDFSRGHSNITYLWTKLPIEGNEDDPTWYAIEAIGKWIIRCEENILDGNTIPIAIHRVLPRPYVWYGNSPLEDKISIQNLQYWLINATVESTTRLMDRMIFYREGDLDVEAINSRHQTGGFIPYRGQQPDLSKLVYSPALPNVSFRESDWLMQEMRREDQDTSPMPNFNPQSEGGPTNKTLGGAQMMASIGEMRTGRLIDQFAIGLKDVAKQTIVLLRNITDDTAPIELSSGEQIDKSELLSDVEFTCKISNVFNYVREGVDAENRLTTAINRRATQLPQFRAIRLGPLIEDVYRNSLKRDSIGDVVNLDALRQIDEQEQQQLVQPPQMQQVPNVPQSSQPTTQQTAGAPQAPQPPQQQGVQL